jgi:hypothetical protein
MNFSRQDDILRCQVKLLALREAAADMLGIIHSGLLTPATEEPAVLAFITDVADRLERTCAPDTAHPIHLNQD